MTSPSLPAIVQAPMAGVSTPELAAAVSNAGALGSIAIGAMNVEAARASIERTLGLTDAPFNVNVFCHRAPAVDAVREQRWRERLAPLFADYGAEPPVALETIYTSFNDSPAMQALLLELRPPLVSFHFGLPPTPVIAALSQAGITLLACATTLDEARRCEAAGVDVIVAQGAEAGGHRGVFEPEQGDAMIGTLALVRLLSERCARPIVAAGGIMDGAGIDAALAAGAVAAQLGTAFVGCPESAASDTHRRWLSGERGLATRVTSAISGRPARAIVNRFVAEVDEKGVPDYPRAYMIGKALASACDDHEFDACWAGQGAALARPMPAAALVETLRRESRRL